MRRIERRAWLLELEERLANKSRPGKRKAVGRLRSGCLTVLTVSGYVRLSICRYGLKECWGAKEERRREATCCDLLRCVG